MNTYRKEYLTRINRVLGYIDRHLDEELTVGKLAGVANFSPFHFHRLFSALTGEPLIAYVRRLRIERAARLLCYEPEKAVTNIAIECGYNSTAVFCRHFREHFGVTAQQFRSEKGSEYSKNHQELSKKGQENSKESKQQSSSLSDISNDFITNKKRKIMKSQIEVKDMPGLKLVRVLHTGPFDLIGKAYEKLMRWAAPRGLLNKPELKTVTVYHDDPGITDIERLRQSACITVDRDIVPEGEFTSFELPGGKYAVGRFEIDETGFKDAWDSVCLWLADSGYQPSDGLPYELYHNNHEEHPERKFILDICIPVKPL